jgi:hypothetical protein
MRIEQIEGWVHRNRIETIQLGTERTRDKEKDRMRKRKTERRRGR